MDNFTRQRVHALWDELSALGACQIEIALVRALSELSALVGAQRAYWFGGIRSHNSDMCDPLYGWKVRASQCLRPSPAFDLFCEEQSRRNRADENNRKRCGKTGRPRDFRVVIHHEIVPDDWHESELYNHFYAPLDMQDLIIVATPLRADVESWFIFERTDHTQPHFGEVERDVLNHAVRPLKWLHRQLVLHRGMLRAERPLKPAERRVLREMLTDKPEREIAATLGLSPSTVHTYASRIIRKFNVRGRAGLMALWLG